MSTYPADLLNVLEQLAVAIDAQNAADESGDPDDEAYAMKQFQALMGLDAAAIRQGVALARQERES